MTYGKFEICTCMCHQYPEGTVKHVMACCFQCPHCGANIKREFFNEHERRCKQEHLDAGLPINQYNVLTNLGEALNDVFKKKPKTIHDEIREEIDREVLKELQECIDEAKRREIEDSPAVKFLRECQEREKRLKK